METEVETKYSEMTNAQLKGLVRSREDLVGQLGKTWITKANKPKLIYALEANDKGVDMMPDTPEKPPEPKDDTRPYFIWKTAIRKREIVMKAATDRVDLHGRRRDKPGKSILIHYGIFIPDDTTEEGQEEVKFLIKHQSFNGRNNDSFTLASETERGVIQKMMASNVRRSEWMTRLRSIMRNYGMM